MAKVSVIVPSRNEQFLVPTVNDLLAKAAGELEVIVILDGYWCDPPLPEDKRLVVLHRGEAHGMRPAINAATRMATGDYFMKIDAHCAITEGYDEVLKAECDGDWIVVPRRDRLEPETWTKQETGKPPIDAHYLSYPYERPGDPKCGMHGTVWLQRARTRLDVLLDDEMSSQGSCWFMTKQHWARLGEMDVEHYGNFIQEFQELGLKTWLGGGRVVVNKKVTYLHLHKGPKYGRGYTMRGSNHEAGAAFCTDYWMNDRWPQRVRDLRWLVEKFAPVPTWPADLDVAFRAAREAVSA